MEFLEINAKVKGDSRWAVNPTEGFIEMQGLDYFPTHIHTSDYYHLFPGATIEVEYMYTSVKNGDVDIGFLVAMPGHKPYEHSKFYTFPNQMRSDPSWITDIIPLPIDTPLTGMVNTDHTSFLSKTN